MHKKTPNNIKYIFANVFYINILLLFLKLFFMLFFTKIENVSSFEIRKVFLLDVRFDIKLTVLTFFALAFLILITNYTFFKRAKESGYYENTIFAFFLATIILL